mmetsp:Transcript_14291/g.21602  ORF Transcript_14291/g.21602 Transcript_14291/m.21602 type:complete len:158 (-) Transcript_14291:201-674(-)
MKRILTEYKEIRELKDSDISLKPIESNNLYKWVCKFKGPEDTPFSNAIFEIKIDLPKNYPVGAPRVVSLTKVFHPNFHWKTGEICMDILKSNWSPSWRLISIVLAIQSLLGNPVANSPLNCDAGNLLRVNDTRGFNNLAKMYSQIYANEKRLKYKYD